MTGTYGPGACGDSAGPNRWAGKTLFESYDLYERIEAEFNEVLDQSLNPRGPDMLYDLVAELALPVGASCLDLGCGRGQHAIALANRFHLNVHGVDPVPYHIDLAVQELTQQSRSNPSLAAAVRFEVGWAEALPVRNESVDLVWCRDVFELVPDLKAAYRELRRVMKPTGHALVYQMFGTDGLDPREWTEGLSLGAAGSSGASAGLPAENMRPEDTESTIRAVGLQIDRCIVVGTEWGEYSQERTGSAGRKLLHAGRLLRDPERYIAKYGQANYDIALADCLWHVYRLIGKLSYRIYLLSPAN
jgi:SAM-dependent methyltransferase